MGSCESAWQGCLQNGFTENDMKISIKIPRKILIPVIIGLAIAGMIAGIVLTSSQALAAPDQPIAFSHKKHFQNKVDCVYCHSGALRSDVAGIPSVQKCMGCHAVVAKSRQAIQVIAGYYERNEPIPWVAVNQEPEFVFFSHQPHMSAGLNCETCHGNVSEMTTIQPVVTMDMGWCLNCHLKQPSDKVGRLTDCLTCHK
jgi:Cytochrome c7 and related cytochrome c/Class III cytochrome C family